MRTQYLKSKMLSQLRGRDRALAEVADALYSMADEHAWRSSLVQRNGILVDERAGN